MSPGSRGTIAEVDGLRALGMSDSVANFDYAISADEEFSGPEHTARVDIQEAGGVKDRHGLRAGSGEGEHEEKSAFDDLNHGLFE